MAGALLGAALAEVALVVRTVLADRRRPSTTTRAGPRARFLYIPTPEALDTVLRALGLGA